MSVVPACVGDEPIASTPTLDAATDVPAVPNQPSADASGSDGDAQLACPPGFADCDGVSANGCEVDTRTSVDHCGACKRECGGSSSCQQGECSVEKLREALDHPFALALAGQRLVWYEGVDAIRGCRTADCATSTTIMVDIVPANDPSLGAHVGNPPRQIAVVGSKFYYSRCPGGANTDCRVASCDITGCKLSGATFLTPANGNRHDQLVVAGPGAIYTWFPLNGLLKTTLESPTVTSAGNYGVIDYVHAIHVDTTNFVYVDHDASLANPNGGVYVCPVGGCPAARTLLLPPPVRHLAYARDSAISTSGGGLVSTASVVACAVTGCGGAGTVLAQNQAFISDIVADDDAVYWTTVGAADPKTNNAAVGTVMRCALPTCAGGPTKIADQVTNPVSIQLDTDYVYWMTYGTGANKDGAVFRRRR